MKTNKNIFWNSMKIIALGALWLSSAVSFVLMPFAALLTALFGADWILSG
jgi:hypothetical protein